MIGDEGDERRPAREHGWRWGVRVGKATRQLLPTRAFEPSSSSASPWREDGGFARVWDPVLRGARHSGTAVSCMLCMLCAWSVRTEARRAATQLRCSRRRKCPKQKKVISGVLVVGGDRHQRRSSPHEPASRLALGSTSGSSLTSLWLAVVGIHTRRPPSSPFHSHSPSPNAPPILHTKHPSPALRLCSTLPDSRSRQELPVAPASPLNMQPNRPCSNAPVSR